MRQWCKDYSKDYRQLIHFLTARMVVRFSSRTRRNYPLQQLVNDDDDIGVVVLTQVG